MRQQRPSGTGLTLNPFVAESGERPISREMTFRMRLGDVPELLSRHVGTVERHVERHLTRIATALAIASHRRLREGLRHVGPLRLGPNAFRESPDGARPFHLTGRSGNTLDCGLAHAAFRSRARGASAQATR